MLDHCNVSGIGAPAGLRGLPSRYGGEWEKEAARAALLPSFIFRAWRQSDSVTAIPGPSGDKSRPRKWAEDPSSLASFAPLANVQNAPSNRAFPEISVFTRSPTFAIFQCECMGGRMGALWRARSAS